VMKNIIMPTVRGMNAEGARYTGFLYAGLMINEHGEAKILEYNCRFGDPETQPIMMRLQSDLVELCMAACDGQLSSQTANWDPRCSLGVVLAASGYPGSYTKGELIHNIPAEQESSKVFHAGTISDSQGNLITNGGRVLCAVSLGDNIRQAQQNAYALIADIDWPGAYYRTDIGYKALPSD
jgi:phosphoribosylamine--glycine ligase